MSAPIATMRAARRAHRRYRRGGGDRPFRQWARQELLPTDATGKLAKVLWSTSSREVSR